MDFRVTTTGRGSLLPATLLAVASTLAAAAPLAHAQQSAPTTMQSPAAEEAQLIAQETYIYLYPLILMDLTRKQLTNIDPKVNPIGGAPNTFANIRTFPSAEMRTVVRPNFDTLYSSAWLDLT